MISIYGTTINDMHHAYEMMMQWFDDKEWDIWIEHTSYGPVIFVEDIMDSIRNSVCLVNLDQVKEFCDKGGFR